MAWEIVGASLSVSPWGLCGIVNYRPFHQGGHPDPPHSRWWRGIRQKPYRFLSKTLALIHTNGLVPASVMLKLRYADPSMVRAPINTLPAIMALDHEYCHSQEVAPETISLEACPALQPVSILVVLEVAQEVFTVLHLFL